MANNAYKILQPEAVTNLVTNPSIETATTGYTAIAGALAQVATYQRRGVYSLEVTPAVGVADGAYYGTVSLTDTVTYTFSFDFLGASAIPYRAYFGTTGAALGTGTRLSGRLTLPQLTGFISSRTATPQLPHITLTAFCAGLAIMIPVILTVTVLDF
jgi:hypothetical protein